jgi:hypothetical protein
MNKPQDAARLALEEFEKDFLQRGWMYDKGVHKNKGRQFLHVWRTGKGWVDEILLAAWVDEHGSVIMRRYVLPADDYDWLRCDQSAFDGFLSIGKRGLGEGKATLKGTSCDCGKVIHRSRVRARLAAKRIQEEYKTEALQRAYRCNTNMRVHHLTTQLKGRRDRIPGAHVDLKKEQDGQA